MHMRATKYFCDICKLEIPDPDARFYLCKHSIVVEVSIKHWGELSSRQFCNHICHRCLLDIARTGDPEPDGWSKEDRIELGIRYTQKLKAA
jgi:hypothetical protein